jgi:hypothetical protein
MELRACHLAGPTLDTIFIKTFVMQLCLLEEIDDSLLKPLKKMLLTIKSGAPRRVAEHLESKLCIVIAIFLEQED